MGEISARRVGADCFKGFLGHMSDTPFTIYYYGWKMTLAPELRALAEVYALLVFHHEVDADERGFPAAAYAAWMGWYQTTPDTPCIAICSTSQGDAYCKGCGRSFGEVQRWTGMTPAQKRQVWRRITLQADAWRFNRYSERAAEGPSPARAD